MKRYASVLIERGTPLHHAALKEGKALLGKLACMGAATRSDHAFKQKKDNTERFVLVFNTGREIDDWMYARWRDDESQSYIKLSAWMTEQVHKGWDVLQKDHKSVMRSDAMTHESTPEPQGSDPFSEINELGLTHAIEQESEPAIRSKPESTEHLLRILERNHEPVVQTKSNLGRFKDTFNTGNRDQ